MGLDSPNHVDRVQLIRPGAHAVCFAEGVVTQAFMAGDKPEEVFALDVPGMTGTCSPKRSQNQGDRRDHRDDQGEWTEGAARARFMSDRTGPHRSVEI